MTLAVYMNDKETQQIINLASGHYLTDFFPCDFHDWDEDDQEEWMLSHAWEPFEGWPVKEVYSLIDSAAYMTRSFVDKDRMALTEYLANYFRESIDNGEAIDVVFNETTLNNILTAYVRGS